MSDVLVFCVFTSLLLIPLSGGLTARLVPERSRYVLVLVVCIVVGQLLVLTGLGVNAVLEWFGTASAVKHRLQNATVIGSSVGVTEVKGVLYPYTEYAVSRGPSTSVERLYQLLYPFHLVRFVSVTTTPVVAATLFFSWLFWPRKGLRPLPGKPDERTTGWTNCG